MPWPAGPLCAALGARAGPRSSPRAFARLRRRLRAARPRFRAPGRDRVLAVRACRARVCRSARGSRSRRGSSARRLRRKRVARRRHGSARARGPKFKLYLKTIRRLSNSLLSTAAARRRGRIRQNCLTHVVAAAFLFPTPYQTPTVLPASRLQKHQCLLMCPFIGRHLMPPKLVLTDMILRRCGHRRSSLPSRASPRTLAEFERPRSRPVCDGWSVPSGHPVGTFLTRKVCLWDCRCHGGLDVERTGGPFALARVRLGRARLPGLELDVVPPRGTGPSRARAAAPGACGRRATPAHAGVGVHEAACGR